MVEEFKKSIKNRSVNLYVPFFSDFVLACARVSVDARTRQDLARTVLVYK